MISYKTNPCTLKLNSHWVKLPENQILIVTKNPKAPEELKLYVIQLRRNQPLGMLLCR